MEVTLNTEPHISAGVVNPTVGKCNITLPGEHAHSVIEWRQRRDQAKGNYTTYERRLRVRKMQNRQREHNTPHHMLCVGGMSTYGTICQRTYNRPNVALWEFDDSSITL